MTYLFTSESVTEGHPDKVCDQISDAVLDAYLAQDPLAHVAVETVVGQDMVHVLGEVTSTATVNVEQVVRDTLRRIGYGDPAAGFPADTVRVLNDIGDQSPEIASGVTVALEVRGAGAVEDLEDRYDSQGAGDQGLMFGHATTETAALMPLPIYLAHRLAQRLAEVRHDGTLDYLYPDGKTQVTVEYEDDGTPLRIDTIVVSTHHSSRVSQDKLAVDLAEHVIAPVLQTHAVGTGVSTKVGRVLVNPSGAFTFGGPAADSGLTGRKIIVDTYGGAAPHGGGAFSGKDPSKVDRSAAYAARWIAKNVVATGRAKTCDVQVAYAIGKARPVSIRVAVTGSPHSNEEWARAVEQVFDLRPLAIIEDLGLRSPIYSPTAAYGHFGTRLGTKPFPWERVNRTGSLVHALLSAAVPVS